MENRVQLLVLGQGQSYICASEHDLTLMSTDRLVQYARYGLQQISEEEWSLPLAEDWTWYKECTWQWRSRMSEALQKSWRRQEMSD